MYGLREELSGPAEPGGWQGGICISVYPIPTEGVDYPTTFLLDPSDFQAILLALKLTSAEVSGAVGDFREFGNFEKEK